MLKVFKLDDNFQRYGLPKVSTVIYIKYALWIRIGKILPKKGQQFEKSLNFVG